MRMPRLYTRQPLAVGESVVLEQAPSHHLLRVLRLQAGDRVLVFNGEGKEYRGTLAGADGKLARLRLDDGNEPQRESNLHISLGQGVSRGERMDLVVQKAVELGVQAITPLWTRRSQVQLSGQRLDKRLSHWRGIVQAACEQSGRVHLPTLNSAARLADWLQAPLDTAAGIVLDPEADLTLHQLGRRDRVRVLIGPEGGFDNEEVECAVMAGYQRVRLGPRILRTETAALATLSALQTLWGDFRS
ncbi:MAG: 16S rRNA (uracil(1498)-N(3))-methyltransferase [Thiogranum sp.]